MTEIELKFQVPAGARAAVEAAVAGRGPGAARQRLVAAYLDTPGRLLGHEGIAWRLRREGRRWVQTLKTAPQDGALTRFEHEVDRGTAAAMPAADAKLHAGTAGGDALAALLAAHPEAAPDPVFATDIRRLSRTVRRGGARIELCLDVGRITAADRSLPVCELELELKGGTPQALIAECKRWVARHGLVLDVRTKAERGDLLARGETMAQPTHARPPALPARAPWPVAARAVLRACSAQVLANASQIAAGPHTPDHVHQLRVGLRRLRTALQLFAPREDAPALFDASLAEGAAELFRRLGMVRDRDVQAGGELARQIDAAFAAAGGTAEAPRPASAGDEADTIVRDAATQDFLLDVVAAGLEPPGGETAEPVDLARGFAAVLARWHRRAARDATGWDTLDDTGRHALRKRIKRLRYAVEFAAPQADDKRVRRYLRPLRALQEQLGLLNDLAVAQALHQAAVAAGGTGPRSWFALGWIAARRDALLAAMPPQLAGFAEAKRFWKKRG
jgi:triphosphatase